MTDEKWPPSFTLDQEKILNLLTGDHFYSNPSAALREAVLNAIDAAHRRRKTTADFTPQIRVTFNQHDNTVSISDNGIGMNQDDVCLLFTKVGASAATAEAKKESVGEFGIGVISYFMAGSAFKLQTYDGKSKSIGLSFNRALLAGGRASEISPTQKTQGSTVTLSISDASIFKELLDSFGYWCRDVDGLSGEVLPDGKALVQGDARRSADPLQLPHPDWVERSHLSPVADPTGWNAMTGISKVAVLYRGVYVQEFEVKDAWGINGSIDVDPKHFKPRLNREGFIGGEFQSEVEGFLGQCHPAILESMALHLSEAVSTGALDKWTEMRWASLWLSVPRSDKYAKAVSVWDAVFRNLPAFQLLTSGDKWEAISLERVKTLGSEIFVAPMHDQAANNITKSAVHLLRNTGKPVIRGVRKDRSWMQFAPATFGTTADLIFSVFASEVPKTIQVVTQADQILANVNRISPLFTGPPPVDLVRLGPDSPPALKLTKRLVINTDHPKGLAIAQNALNENRGAMSLIEITACHAHEQLGEVAAVVRGITGEPEILSPVRRSFIRSKLS